MSVRHTIYQFNCSHYTEYVDTMKLTIDGGSSSTVGIAVVTMLLQLLLYSLQHHESKNKRRKQ